MKAVAGFFAALLAMVMVGPALLAGAVTTDVAYTQSDVAGCSDIDAVLATIAYLESRGDYTAEATGSSASGAYQFIDSTWDRYGGYRRAVDAPPEVQDAKAVENVQAVLDTYQDVAAVPAVWYIGRYPAPTDPQWDQIPAPSAGNVLTVREYQTRWLAKHAELAAAGCQPAGGVYDPTGFPSSFSCGGLRWGDYSNGNVPAAALAYRPFTGSMHPQAGADYQRLYEAAAAAGFDIGGYSYRDASGQAKVAAGGSGAPVGRSCHGLGVAIDISILVPCTGTCAGRPYRTTTAAFASGAYQWLCDNAHYYGFISPRWAQPAGASCTGIVGTGTGGGTAGVLEPWHFEAAGVITSHPDFNSGQN